jgi:hypothetical protein
LLILHVFVVGVGRSPISWHAWSLPNCSKLYVVGGILFFAENGYLEEVEHRVT